MTNNKRVRGQEPATHPKKVAIESSHAPEQKRASKSVIHSNGKAFILQIDDTKAVDDASFQRVLTEKPTSSSSGRFQQLLQPLDANEFFENCFEKMCVHIKRNASCSEVFSLQQLYEIVEQNELSYEHNMTLCQYDHGRRTNALMDGRVHTDNLKRHFEKLRMTIQFYQPQRFSDALWYLQHDFEHVFGCLAGASAYLTPSNSQGLPPHYDDVCVFIIQTEGSKTWNLYQPSEQIALAEEHSGNLAREQLGEPQRIVLNPGDMLYMPRGTVHEAVANATSTHSTHVTISVYQKHNYKSFLSNMLPTLLEKAFAESIEYRRGLPRDVLSISGSYADFAHQNRTLLFGTPTNTVIAGERRQQLHEAERAASISAARKHFTDNLKLLTSRLASFISDDMVSSVSDSLAEDFMQHRLPPPAEQISPTEDRPKIEWSPTTMVRLCNPKDMRAELFVNDEGATMLRVTTCRCNDRMQHMGHPLSGEDGHSSDDGEQKAEEDKEEDEDSYDENEDEDADDNESDDSFDMDKIPRTFVFPGAVANMIFLLQAQYPSYTKFEDVTDYVAETIEVPVDRSMFLECLYYQGFLDVQAEKPKAKKQKQKK